MLIVQLLQSSFAITVSTKIARCMKVVYAYRQFLSAFTDNHIVRKNWPYPPTTSGSYGKEADIIEWVSKFLRILYRLTIWALFLISLQCYYSIELHFNWLLSCKVYFKVCFKVKTS